MTVCDAVRANMQHIIAYFVIMIIVVFVDCLLLHLIYWAYTGPQYILLLTIDELYSNLNKNKFWVMLSGNMVVKLVKTWKLKHLYLIF